MLKGSGKNMCVCVCVSVNLNTIRNLWLDSPAQVKVIRSS